MRRSKRQARRAQLELGRILLVISLLVAGEVLNKTKSWPLTLLTFMGPFILLMSVRGIRWLLRKKALLESGIEAVDRMSGREFEQMLLVHFQAQGYTGTLTPDTGDYGADLVLEKDGRKLVVQAKRWRDVVGIEAVQQVIGAIKYYGASKGIVVTNSVFTENAIALAQVNAIELIDREKLIVLLRKSRGKACSRKTHEETEEPYQPIGIKTFETCPRCGKLLVHSQDR